MNQSPQLAWFSFFLLLVPKVLTAQISAEYVTLGYLGHYGYQPGIQAGVQWSLTEFPNSSSSPNIAQSLFLHPQLGRYTRPSSKKGVLPLVDVGYRRISSEKSTYWSIAGGVGYLFEDTIESFTVALGSGDQKNEKRVRDHAWVTMLSLEHDFRISDELLGYVRASSGPTFYENKDTAWALFLGFGIKFSLR